jgi:transcriptional regulator with XRE-family HTH domain
MTNNFALSPALVRELGYLFNGRQHSGWANRVSELIEVSPRTVEAWARGERQCEGPPALLMAYIARMIVNETYSDISLDEVTRIVENYGKKVPLELDLPEVRTRIRSLIRLNSSIKKVSEDLSISRSALSRWLSGDNALGFDLISKVLDHIGLNRDMDDKYEKTWHARLDWEAPNEVIQDIRDAIELFFPAPPKCLLAQVDKPTGRIVRVNASLLHQRTTVIIEFSMPTKLARHGQGLDWLLSAFEYVSSFTFFCPLNIEDNLKECDDPGEGLDVVQS